MSLIGLLVALIVACVVVWAAKAIMAAFGVGDPIRTVVIVVIVLIVVLWLAGQFGYGPGLGVRL